LLLYSVSEVLSLLLDGMSAVSIGSAADVDGKSCGGRVDNGVNGMDARRFGGRPPFFFAGVVVEGPATSSSTGTSGVTIKKIYS
jgi:hypothetical protein